MATPPSPDLKSRAIIGRLLRDYVRREWGLLALAILAMLLASAMGVAIPWMVNTLVKQIFLRRLASLLLPLSLMAFGIMVVRAAAMYSGRALTDTLGERAVARAQGDMFGSLIRRDLADLNAVHSGQFVSNFLYDATLMRDALTQGVAAIFLEVVQMLGFVRLCDGQRLAIGIDLLAGAAGGGLGDGAAGRTHAPRRHPGHAGDGRSFGGAVGSDGWPPRHQGL